MAITGAAAGSTSSLPLPQGRASVNLSRLRACSPLYASTAPQALSGAAFAVPVSVASNPAQSIFGMGLVMRAAADICCTILPGDFICFRRKAGQPRQIGIVAGISWPGRQPSLCSRTDSSLTMQILLVASETASGFYVQSLRQKPKSIKIPFSAVLSTACLLSVDEFRRAFPEAAHACPADTCLQYVHGKVQELLGLPDEHAGPAPSWRRLEVLVQSVGADQQVHSAICRQVASILVSNLPISRDSRASMKTVQSCTGM